MRTRSIVTAAVLSCAIVSGGWLVQRGLISTGHTAATKVDGRHLYDQVLQRVQQEYIDTIAAQDVYRRTVDGLMLELGDPHSAYLPADRLSRLNESTSGRYAGVGIQIDVREGWITVVAPLPDSPAESAGIRTGDRIVEIDGRSTHRLTSEEAQKALRGQAGTTVVLGVDRFGMSGHLSFKLTRQLIRIRSVQRSQMVRDGVGYVNLLAFSDSAAPELRRQIDSLRGAGMKRLLLDLRGDPGGLLDQGVAVTELFLDPGQPIVSMRGRSADVTRNFSDHRPQAWPDLIVGVLVDSLSASASEIVAGALQDHDRAVVMGTTTYGKGSAQAVFAVPGGGLKLTIAKWFTPSGRSINRAHGPAARDADSLRNPKPLPTFRTDSGRAVVGGGGIRPDLVMVDSAAAAAAIALTRAVGTKVNVFRDVLTGYALSFKGTGTIGGSGFPVTPAMRQELIRRLAERKVVLDPTTARTTGPVLDRLLALQIERYLFGTRAEFDRTLREDPVVQRAVTLLAGAKTQKEAIERAK